jgi:hypothetical protein
MPRLIAVLFVCLGLLAVPHVRSTSLAQEPTAPPFEQVKLTPDMVKRFLASFAQIKKVGKKYEAQTDRSASSSNGPMAAVSAYIQNEQARAQIEKILQANGFSDFLEWSKVGQSVGLAYGFVKSKRSPEELQQQAEQAIALIRKNDRFSDQQKERMIALMRQQLGSMSRFTPLPGNAEVVGGMMDEIKPVMDSD